MNPEKNRENFHSDTRQVFGSELGLNNFTTKLESISELEKHKFKIVEIFNRYGIVNIEFESHEEPNQQLLALQEIFGSTKIHDRSDQDGVAEIKVSDKHPGYLGTSNEPHPLHTDGSYDDSPPAIVALRCNIPAQIGGLTQLASAKALHDWLAKKDPEALRSLYERQAMQISRAGKITTKSVFTREENRIKMSYRSDITAKFADNEPTHTAIDLIQNFLADKNNIIEYKMEAGQILITNNGSVLHGRTSFPADDPRQMHRLFFDGKPKSKEADLKLGFETDQTI